jgi:hypothetical protein
MKLLIPLLAISLAGCINVYGPVKPGGQTDSAAGSQTAGMGDAASVIKIGNRKPDELIAAVELYYRQKGLSLAVQDATTGIVAASGSDAELAGLYLDCSSLPQTQNTQQQFRIVTQVWSAGEGSNVSVDVTGFTGLVTADGNDKIKPVECRSSGLFEKDLLERLRK